MHDEFDGVSHPPKMLRPAAATDTVALKQRIDRDDKLVRANTRRVTTPAGRTLVDTPTSTAARARMAARTDTLNKARKGGR